MFSIRPLRSLIKVAERSVKSSELASTAEVRSLVSKDLAEKLLALPLKISEGKLLIVATPESVKSASEALRFASGMPVEVVKLLPHRLLLESLYNNYYGAEERLEHQSRELREVTPPVHLSLNEIEARDERGEVPRFLTTLFDYALTRNASDIHIVPRRDGTFIRLRVEGLLLDHEAPICCSALHPQLVQRVKVLSKLDTTVRHLPQDGSFMFPTPVGQTAVRVSTMPTIHGEKVVMRLMGRRGVPSLDELGLSSDVKNLLLNVLHDQQGAIVVSGPTGSGKSTTLYASLKHLTSRNLNVVSLEDPVEQMVDGVSQTSIDISRNFGYPEALKSVLRQDPDVIMIGEMRDASSAGIAINAALTGHMVLSTTHGGTALEVLHRFRQLGVDDLTLSQALRLIICQRLLPKLCTSCKVLDLNVSNEMKMTVYRPVGCHQCDYSGFDGVTIAAEYLRVVPPVRDHIAAADLSESLLREAMKHNAYLTLNQSLLLLTQQGHISPPRSGI